MSNRILESEPLDDGIYEDGEQQFINAYNKGCDDGCGHDHGNAGGEGGHKKHKKRSSGLKRLLKDRNGTLKTVYFIYQSTNCWIMMRFHLRGFEDEFHVWLLWWTMILCSGMMLATHLVSGNTKVTKFDRRKQRGFFGDDYYECERCKDPKWKPERMRHCSITGDCIMRFDHYCPALLGPVGYRNHGTFIITAWFHMINIFLFLSSGTVYLFNNLFADIWGYNGMVIALVIVGGFLNCLLLLTIFFLSCGIGIGHLIYALNNSTTIDSMNSFSDEIGPYDKFEGSYSFGTLYNLRQYFAQPYLFFWWPNFKDAKYEGYWYAKIGISREEIKCSTKISNKCRVNGCDLVVEDNTKFMDIAGMMYKTHTLLYNGYTLSPDGTLKQSNVTGTLINPRKGGVKDVEQEAESLDTRADESLTVEDRLIKD